MRQIILLLALLFATPALAAGWGSYENARFGYAVGVPPDFIGGDEPANGDGLVFTRSDGAQSLRVYGANNMLANFELAAGKSAEYYDGQGWNISYQRTTPNWASFSGSKAGKVLYVRMISLCDGTQYATFELQYPKRDMSEMDAVVDRLVGSLVDTGNGISC